jgi:hypothetical protein
LGHVPCNPWQGETSIDPTVQNLSVLEVDTLLIYTIIIYVAAIIMIGWFINFTLKLIKQHNDIYPLLYDLEEAEKKKERGEG